MSSILGGENPICMSSGSSFYKTGASNAKLWLNWFFLYLYNKDWKVWNLQVLSDGFAVFGVEGT